MAPPHDAPHDHATGRATDRRFARSVPMPRSTHRPLRAAAGGTSAKEWWGTRRRGAILVDAIAGTVIVAVALASILSLAGRALVAQGEGERLQTAAALLDEQLQLVLIRGPDNYEGRFPIQGVCEPPFEDFSYELRFSGGTGGDAYHVRATVRWMAGGRERSASVETYIAPRLGDDPDPDRRPAQPVDRNP
jgi:hypothetical protein